MEDEFERVFAKIVASRREFTTRIFTADALVLAFQVFIGIIVWGDGLATFINVLAIFWEFREIVRHVQMIRMMIDEENKLRRDKDLANQSKGSRRER